MMTSQEAARAELEQSVVDDDGKAGTPKAANGRDENKPKDLEGFQNKARPSKETKN